MNQQGLIYGDEAGEEVGLGEEVMSRGGATTEQKMVAVQGQDGQQYVVLEVIHLQVSSQGRWRHGLCSKGIM